MRRSFSSLQTITELKYINYNIKLFNRYVYINIFGLAFIVCPTSSTVNESASLELVKNPPHIMHSLMNTEDRSTLNVDNAKVSVT